MQQVVDASVVAKWFLPEPHKDKAEILLRNFLEEKLDLAAPDLLVAEVGNLLWKRSILRGELSPHQAAQSYHDFLMLGLQLIPSSGIAATALNLATLERHSIYDMLYLAVAEDIDCEFVTADEKLMNKLAGRFGRLRWLGDL